MHFACRNAALALFTVTLASCAAKPVEDTTPLVRTAIINSSVSNSGVKGFGGHKGTFTSSTTTDIQRRDDTFKFSGAILSRVGGTQNRSNIVRLDKDLEWALDNKRKNYSECPLGGCRSAFDGLLSAEYEQEQEDDFDTQTDASCQLISVKNTFDIKETGQTRNINGFNANEYLIDWRLTASDTEGKTLENIMEINLWTTPETPLIAEALRMQNVFDKRYANARGETYPANVLKALPKEVIELFTKHLLAGINEVEIAKLKNLMAGAATIEGFPISRKVKWDARNDTCAAPPEPEAENESRLNTSSFRGLLESVGKQIVKQEVDKKVDAKKREIALAPIMLFVEEVESIEISKIRESRLSVPAKYNLINRR